MFERSNGFCSHHAIGLFFVVAFGLMPTQRRAKLPGSNREYLILFDPITDERTHSNIP